MEPKKPYSVGYGKPPMHTRFKKGQSGNPKGRPKGSRNFAKDVRAALEMPVKVTRNGKPCTVSTQRAALLRLIDKALRGDGRAIDRLLQLAQAHNNEEQAPVADVSNDDAMLLETFQRRLQSGATQFGAESADERETARRAKRRKRRRAENKIEAPPPLCSHEEDGS